MVIGIVDINQSSDVVMQLQAVDFAGGKLVNLQNGVTVKVGDRVVDAADITVNYAKGLISVKVGASDKGQDIKATYKAMHYGTPSWADFKGVHGAMYVLLKK